MDLENIPICHPRFDYLYDIGYSYHNRIMSDAFLFDFGNRYRNFAQQYPILKNELDNAFEEKMNQISEKVQQCYKLENSLGYLYESTLKEQLYNHANDVMVKIPNVISLHERLSLARLEDIN